MASSACYRLRGVSDKVLHGVMASIQNWKQFYSSLLVEAVKYFTMTTANDFRHVAFDEEEDDTECEDSGEDLETDEEEDGGLSVDMTENCM